jgi:hypothetical protein
VISYGMERLQQLVHSGMALTQCPLTEPVFSPTIDSK